MDLGEITGWYQSPKWPPNVAITMKTHSNGRNPAECRKEMSPVVYRALMATDLLILTVTLITMQGQSGHVLPVPQMISTALPKTLKSD